MRLPRVLAVYLYKVNTDEGAEALPPVVLEDQGAAGMYNRANRSLHHFIENLPGLLLCYPAAAFCFPLPAMVLAVVFCVGRVMHQVGYTKGYGSHGLGFVVSLLATVAVEGLVIVASLKGAGVSV
jgi:hypothetical protein